MHVYGAYAAPSAAAEVELVRRHPFALVVSTSDDAPVATHVPVILPPDTPAPDALDGVTLLGHMARRNPQWQAFADGPPVLLVFSSGHGYVSPSTYGFAPAVPTLNYAAVHVTGTVELADDPATTLHVVEATVRALESQRDPGWDMAASRARFAELAPHVVAFRVHVTAVRSMFKLSQDMPADVRGRVGADIAGSNPALAELMAAVQPQASPG
ncbi:FMN-binding negative transcriptional regulator [Pseudonocardia sp. TRM90224]|uniref:FMN-binding negative transcriptional regulator n=1 Tax=Pseudonocardia sp. TRM90224 TaxID=2812678 RepID=UPI001E36FCA2|nr:FMN-binding negative transcriptional regulator [Pseudonocardia sp. TRM90224]